MSRIKEVFDLTTKSPGKLTIQNSSICQTTTS